ncbi:hypothetical protein SD71_06110 [Cohnella kolymensis]|uniref:HTH tetR-type domain-containing protein n=1 Tax=Cohnella kolymensis TaxID=1590652 RepID=A0ABR5A6C7_9BACL|nr:TetR family transcriptional regulator [Cohnella kolymensis]KIL36596.1 hypothetical protein SD71_06110 [Cohnella kolymensis]
MSPKVSDEHREQRIRQILEAAERVFARKGYEPVTMKDIVEEAQMSRGWIYLYFQSKEEIFEAFMEKKDEESGREMQTKLSGTSSVWDAIRLMFSQVKTDLASSDNNTDLAFYEFYISGYRNEARRALFTRRYDQAIARIVPLIQLGIDRGELSPILPVELAVKIASSHLDGILIHQLAVGPEKTESVKQIDALIEYLRHLLGVKVQ